MTEGVAAAPEIAARRPLSLRSGAESTQSVGSFLFKTTIPDVPTQKKEQLPRKTALLRNGTKWNNFYQLEECAAAPAVRGQEALPHARERGDRAGVWGFERGLDLLPGDDDHGPQVRAEGEALRLLRVLRARTVRQSSGAITGEKTGNHRKQGIKGAKCGEIRRQHGVYAGSI